MQNVTQQSRLYCTEHGDISAMYNNQCKRCLDTISASKRQRLNKDSRIVDGKLETYNFSDGWKNPFDRRFERWTK